MAPNDPKRSTVPLGARGAAEHQAQGRARNGETSSHATSLAAVRVPIAEYFVLEPEPHLVAHECSTCRARYFDHRIACAACGATEFGDVRLGTGGVLKTFTIIGVAPEGVPTPYIAAIVDCDGTDVRANIMHVEPTPDRLRSGMKLRLCTISYGLDSRGVEAIGYGFEPE